LRRDNKLQLDMYFVAVQMQTATATATAKEQTIKEVSELNVKNDLSSPTPPATPDYLLPPKKPEAKSNSELHRIYEILHNVETPLPQIPEKPTPNITISFPPPSRLFGGFRVSGKCPEGHDVTTFNARTGFHRATDMQSEFLPSGRTASDITWRKKHGDKISNDRPRLLELVLENNRNTPRKRPHGGSSDM
jgi:hypothetical protein